jgi:5,10-methenyltetrahydrofolate synthetase
MSFADQKKVLVPVWSKSTDMYMTEVFEQREYQELLTRTGEYYKERYGHSIPMPNPKTSRAFQGVIDMAIIPGIAFCAENLGRIGYGYGHYDRFLASHQVLCKVGVCHEMQLIQEYTPDPFDIPMDFIATPQRILKGLNRSIS